MSKRGTSASGYQASREKYKCPVKECQKSELRGDDIPLGQVSGGWAKHWLMFECSLQAFGLL